MSATIAVYELQDVRPMVDLFVFSYLRTCAAYDATVTSLGYDEVRVRFRQQRREIVREIICKKHNKLSTLAYLESAAGQLIPESYRQAFMEDVLEDLTHIDSNRIGGMGISPDDLQEWRSVYTQTS